MITDLTVISGKYKGTRLASPRHVATHPMGAREKNALFNMLQPWIQGATVLDAYAGSGALGIEALSRGAAGAVFVERAAPVVRTLRENLGRIQAQTELVAGNIVDFASNLNRQGKFDLIIADPPYDDFRLQEIETLETLLVTDGVLALSYPGKLGELQLSNLTLIADRRYAAARIGIYQKHDKIR